MISLIEPFVVERFQRMFELGYVISWFVPVVACKGTEIEIGGN